MYDGFDMNIIIHILTNICKWIIHIQIIVGNKNTHEYDTNDDAVYIQLTTMKNIMRNKVAFTIKYNKEIRWYTQRWRYYYNFDNTFTKKIVSMENVGVRYYVLIELLILLGIYANKGDIWWK